MYIYCIFEYSDCGGDFINHYNYINTNVAIAHIKGNANNSGISGVINFTKTSQGVLVETTVYGLLKDKSMCSNDFCAMHIHDGINCDFVNNEYINLKDHYNLNNCPHPEHKGDLLPIVKNKTFSYSKVLYTKFALEELMGKFVVIHESSDDFKTDPHGNAGKKIACGQILRK